MYLQLILMSSIDETIVPLQNSDKQKPNYRLKDSGFSLFKLVINETSTADYITKFIRSLDE